MQKCIEMNGFFLDMNYITPNVVASARPSSSFMERLTKNPLEDTVRIHI